MLTVRLFSGSKSIQMDRKQRIQTHTFFIRFLLTFKSVYIRYKSFKLLCAWMISDMLSEIKPSSIRFYLNVFNSFRSLSTRRIILYIYPFLSIKYTYLYPFQSTWSKSLDLILIICTYLIISHIQYNNLMAKTYNTIVFIKM